MSQPSRARRWVRWLAGTLLALVLLRVAVALAVPSLVGRAARSFGCACAYESSRLSLARGVLELDGVVLAPAGTEVRAAAGAWRIGRLRVDLSVPALVRGIVRVQHLDVADGELSCERAADGSLDPMSAQVQRELAASLAARGPRGLAPAFELAVLHVESMRLHVVDHSPVPAFEVHAVAGADVVARGSGPAHATFDLAAPGFAANVRGALDVTLDTQHVAVAGTIEASDASLAVFAPYLAHACVAPALEHGAWSAQLRAEFALADVDTWTGSATIEHASVREGTRELAALDRCACAGITLAPGRLSLDRVDLAGVRAAPVRTRVGRWRALGLAVTGADAGAVPRAADASPWPRFDLGVAQIDGVELHFVDELRGSELVVRDGTCLVENLGFGGASTRGPTQFGGVRGRCVFAPVCAELTVEGDTIGKPGPLDLDVQVTVRGNGVDLRPLGPWLAPFGLEPELAAGAFRTRFETRLRASDDALAARVFLRDVAFVDGKTPLLEVDRAGCELVARPDGVHVATLDVAIASVDVTRETGGSLRMLGLRAPATDAHALLESLCEVAPVELDDVQLRFAGAWHDRASEPALDWKVRGALAAPRVVAGRGAGARSFTGELSIAGELDAADLVGEVQLDPCALVLRARVRASGVRDGALDRYLPDGARLELEQGRFEKNLELELRRSAPGRWSGGAKLGWSAARRDVELRLVAR